MLNNLLSKILSQPKMLVLITGASGAGKTTILKELAKQLQHQEVELNYFDDIGVPPFEKMIADFGSCEKWQETMTHKWIEQLANTDKKLIFLEGQFNPDFAVEACKKFKVENYRLFCVHTDPALRSQRLNLRGQPELATEQMSHWAEILKQKTIAHGGTVIESNQTNLQENVEQILIKIS